MHDSRLLQYIFYLFHRSLLAGNVTERVPTHLLPAHSLTYIQLEAGS